MKYSPNRQLSGIEFLPLVAALLIACGIAVLCFRDWHVYDHWREEARRDDQLVARIDALGSEMRDAETGQRGYLLTGKEPYLEPFNRSLVSIPREFAFVSQLATPSERARLAELRSLVDSKLAELQKTVKLKRQGQSREALALVDTDEGKRVMDAIRASSSALLKEEDGDRQFVRDQMGRSTTALRWVSVFGSASLAALLLAAQIALARTNAKRLRLTDDLRQTRDQATAARDLFQTTLQSIGDAVISTDADGRVTFMNPVSQQLTGWTQQSGMGVPLHRVFRIVNETTRDTVEDPVQKVIRTGRIVGLANHTVLITVDGREIPVEDSAAPIRGPKGELVGTVLVFRDVTERRRAELQLQQGRSELEKSNASLRQANSDLELFAYAAAHDLQEPLRTIASYCGLVARKLEGNSETAQYLRFIQLAVGRMRALIDGLLSYSLLLTGGQIESAEISMEEVLGEALLNCETAIVDSGAKIHNGSLPVVVANRQHMVHLVQNLVSNAIKYRSEKSPEIHVTATLLNERDWLFAVADNGLGIDMQHADFIFQAFKRLHRSDQYQGTGLGLAMCKRIVELHGGRIWVESEPGCGSVFRFTLPVTRSGSSQTA